MDEGVVDVPRGVPHALRQNVDRAKFVVWSAALRGPAFGPPRAGGLRRLPGDSDPHRRGRRLPAPHPRLARQNPRSYLESVHLERVLARRTSPTATIPSSRWG